MGKQKRNNHQKSASAGPTRPVEPTPDQTRRLVDAENEVESMTRAHGDPGAPSAPEPLGTTLEESLKRAEKLLEKAKATFQRAEQQAREAKKKCEDLARDEEGLKERVRAVEAGERSLQERSAACEEREAAVAEAKVVLVQRELNAERGFLAEKRQALGPIEEDLGKLRAEKDGLQLELAALREEAERERRERVAEQIKAEAKARRELDEELDEERRAQLAKLRAQVATERAEAEASLEKDLKQSREPIEALAAELDNRQQELVNQSKSLRAAQLDLEAERELLDEDRAGLERKLERLLEGRTENLRHDKASLEHQLQDASTKRDEYFADLESRRELDRRFGDRRPEEVLAAIDGLEAERDDLERRLRERPDEQAAERLAKLERQRSEWLERRATLEGDLARAHGELATRRLSAIELEGIRKEKEALECHKQLLDGAVDELRTQVDELTRQEDNRNPMTALVKLDEDENLLRQVPTVGPLGGATSTLRDFAVDLRHRIANGVEGRTLYYAERDVRAFLGGIAMTRLMLLQGISGTGKTSLPLAFASAVGGDVETVEVQAGWRDRQDLIGYYNAFHRHYYATNFLQALYRAGTPAFKDRHFIMVLDEINLSRPEQFFADFLSALEQPMEKRRLTLVNDPVADAPKLMVGGRHLPIPPNVWFVGTANHDESTAEFADKTYDRAHVMEMPRKKEEAHFEVEEKKERKPISYRQLEESFVRAQNDHSNSVKDATKWLQTAAFADELGKRFRVGWGNRLEQQLGRYLPVVVAAGGSVGEAMDHLLVTKVLRKLQDRHDVRATALESLREQLEDAWGKLDRQNGPNRCLDLIEKELSAKKGEELE